MWVELTVVPSNVTAGITSHPMPRLAAFFTSRAGVPAFWWPKRKSCPATSHPARSSWASISRKSTHGRVIIFPSKGAAMTSRMENSSRTTLRFSSVVVKRGTRTPVTNSRGERSKVNTAGSRSRSSARSAVLRSSAWWPRCTPSKKPRAITFLFSFMGTAPLLRHTFLCVQRKRKGKRKTFCPQSRALLMG